MLKMIPLFFSEAGIQDVIIITTTTTDIHGKWVEG